MGADKQDLPGASCCCASPVKAPESADNNSSSAWNTRYFLIIVVLAALWWLAYSYILPASNWLVFGLFGVAPDSHRHHHVFSQYFSAYQ